jgi:cell division transport system permease protein
MRLRFVLAELWGGLRRNLVMTTSAILTATIALYMVGFGVLAKTTSDHTRTFWYSRLQVTVFLNDNISEAQRDALNTSLVHNSLVQDVQYESKQQAYENFQRLFKNSPELVRNVEESSLPASFRVTLRDPKLYDRIQAEYGTAPGVKKVSDPGAVLRVLFDVMAHIRLGSIVVAAVAAVAAFLLIMTSIRVAAQNRRREVGIMRLVGASKLALQLPFLLEGLLEGLLGAGLAIGCLYLTERFFVRSALRPHLQFIEWVTAHDVTHVVPLLLIAAAIVSVPASYVSLRRYTRV